MAAGTALTGKTGANIFLEYSGAVELGTPKMVLSVNAATTWTFGTGANQINVVYQDYNRSTDNTGETLDLYASGTLLDCFGNALTMTALKLLYVKNTHATLTLGLMGAAALDLLILSGTTDALEIPPGGHILWQAPSAAGIVLTTNKNLFVNATTAATITYDIIAAGLD